MRMLRVLSTTLAATVLGAGLMSVPAVADEGEEVTRVITVTTKQKDYRTFKLKGVAEDLVKGKVVVERKKCGTCDWTNFRKLKTTSTGRFSTKIFAPDKGKALYRVRVNAQDGYDKSYSRKVAISWTR